MSSSVGQQVVKSRKQDVLKRYEEQREKVKEIFSKFDGRVSISVDSPLYEKSWVSYEYQLCISAHFIDNDWKLRKWVIQYCGGDRFFVIDAVLKSLKDWEIEGKVICITGDRDTADAVKKDIQQRREIVLNGQLFHVQCSCAIICQMVLSAFEMIDEIIDKVQLLSWSKSLPLWYLTTFKLQNALEMNGLGEFSRENVSDIYEIPSEEEWAKVRVVWNITDRIYRITKPLYEAKKQTANLFLPRLLEIRTYLAQQSASADAFVQAVAQKMLETYTVYFNDMFPVLAVTAFVDPRYKMRLIESYSSEVRCEEKVAHVLETIRKLYDSYTEQNNDHQPLKSDLDHYLEEPVLPSTSNFSVLKWWKDNCLKYPRLSKMARDFLAIPMTLGTSYEAYYTEPRVADSTVASLEPELMNAVVCTKSWNLGSNNHH